MFVCAPHFPRSKVGEFWFFSVLGPLVLNMFWGLVFKVLPTGFWVLGSGSMVLDKILGL